MSVELETFLEARGKKEPARRDPEDLEPDQLLVRPPGGAARPRPRGARHAHARRRRAVRGDPGDDVIDATPPALAQMIEVFDEVRDRCWRSSGCRSDVSSYGIIDAEEMRPGVYRIRDLVEKPPRDEAPSDLAIIGRYILTPDIFPALEATESDRTGEIQLTNGLRQLLKERPIYGCRIDGVRHDTGNKLGFLKAVVYFALRRPDLAGPVHGLSADDRIMECRSQKLKST